MWPCVIFLQELSLRPDIRLGRVLSDGSCVPPASNVAMNFNSNLTCSFPLVKLATHPPSQGDLSDLRVDQQEFDVSETADQSHLTKVVVGCEEDDLPQDENIPDVDEILQQVKGLINISQLYCM